MTTPPTSPPPASPTTTTAEVGQPSPIPPAEAGSSSGSSADIFVSGAVIAAVVGAVINLALARYKDVADERARLRTSFAEAFEIAVQYKEFPYAIRRRNADEPATERVRLSTELSKVQARLSYFTVWTTGESEPVGKAYKSLIDQLRMTAGTACREAWLAPSITADREMNISSSVVDLSALTPYETAYVEAVHRHLARYRGLRGLLRRT